MLSEIKIDIDLDKETIWTTFYKLFRLYTFFTFMYPAIVRFYTSGKGIHIRILVPKMDFEKILTVRAEFGDDERRLALDTFRYRRSCRSLDILFNFRYKKRCNVKVGVERVLEAREVVGLLTYLAQAGKPDRPALDALSHLLQP